MSAKQGRDGAEVQNRLLPQNPPERTLKRILVGFLT
jgi:hypothetical protein